MNTIDDITWLEPARSAAVAAPRTHLGRRAALLAMTGLAISSASPLTHAQASFPDKPLHVVIPFAAGSSPDAISRLWGEKVSQVVKQPVVIDNKPGAATIIGTQAVISSPADGYTLLYTVANTTSINPYIYKSLPYKVEDLVPVARILSVPLVLVVSGNSPIRSVQDLVQAGKKNPGRMNYPSYGIGTSTHVAMARFLSSAGITMTHVPYKDGGLTDVMAGQLDASFEPSTTAMAHIKAGRLRALAVSSPEPVPALPGVAPLAEQYPGFVGDSWHGIFVPKGTPASVVARLASMTEQIVASDDFRKKLGDLGLVPAKGNTKDFEAFLADDSKAWQKVVKDYDIRAD